MIRNIQYSFQQRPAWQRLLMVLVTIVITATLFWVGLIVVFSLAFVALGVALLNKVKIKLTGRPLFKGPQHFHRYQSQFNQRERSESTGNVIEGEVIRKDD